MVTRTYTRASLLLSRCLSPCFRESWVSIRVAIICFISSCVADKKEKKKVESESESSDSDSSDSDSEDEVRQSVNLPSSVKAQKSNEAMCSPLFSSVSTFLSPQNRRSPPPSPSSSTAAASPPRRSKLRFVFFDHWLSASQLSSILLIQSQHVDSSGLYSGARSTAFQSLSAQAPHYLLYILVAYFYFPPPSAF